MHADFLQVALEGMHQRHKSADVLAHAQLELAQKREKQEQEILERQIQHEDEERQRQKEIEQWNQVFKMAESANPVL